MTTNTQNEMPLELWYNRPSERWTDALPIGNGRMGAMVYGGIESETLMLNEDTLWSGYPHREGLPHASERLGAIRSLVLDGKYSEAHALSKQVSGPYGESYLPLGALHFTFHHGHIAGNYRRGLDLSSGIATTSYQIGQTTFHREAFVSHPHQALVVRFTADGPLPLSFQVRMDSKLPYQLETGTAEALVLQGCAPMAVTASYQSSDDPMQYPEHPDDPRSMRFCATLRVLHCDGIVESRQDGLRFRGCRDVVLIVGMATTFSGFDQMPGLPGVDAQQKAADALSPLMNQSFKTLRQSHIADHQALFNRVSLHLGHRTAGPTTIPTDQLLTERGASEAHLVELLFQYGRYLLIASSRPGTQAANLQGIWNAETRPPWCSNWTININTEMNYWHAETANLSECHESLFDLISGLRVNGARTAEDYACRGWAAHHNMDLWRLTDAAGGLGDGDPSWSMWPMAGPWLCAHLWEHYRFSCDTAFLRDIAYPIMRDASLFCLDWMAKDPSGQGLTIPSTSPEHGFVTDDGQRSAVGASSTMDAMLLWELFTHCLEGAVHLGVDDHLQLEWERALQQLRPLHIGKHGQLQEWQFDFEDWEVHHRHVSHLYGLFPGYQLALPGSAALRNAALASLIRRGDDGTGWSLAWKTGLWARLGDGNHALKLIDRMLTLVGDNPNQQGGGVYRNLFDAHPPFQIDGNFGVSAGICEMLVQSHLGVIQILPALPDDWSEGTIHGIRCRGGFEVDIKWDDHTWQQIRVHSINGQVCRLTATDLDNMDVLCKNERVPTETMDNQLVFETTAGQRYDIHRR